MIYIFYNIILTFIIILFIPYFIIRFLVQKDFKSELLERMGYFHQNFPQKNIWLHAASVGEVFGCLPLLKNIKEEFPKDGIILTTMTRTGREVAKKSSSEINEVLFFPIDYPFFLKKVIRKLKPRLLLIAETELWPNLIISCGRLNIPIILFNGRISRKSFPRYKFFKFFFKRFLKYVSLFLMQTEEDRLRVLKIGAPPERAKVTGNIKFDITPPPSWEGKRTEFLKIFGNIENHIFLIAGSTHSGEEEILIKTYKKLIKSYPELILILAPRHLQRIREVEEILRKESISWVRRTSFSLGGNKFERNSYDVILLDTIGELINLYSLATIVFIGGSLTPVGGHNPIEPLLFKKCVLFGPYMFNFKEISNLLVEAGGAIQVKDDIDLFYQLKRLLSDEISRNKVGQIGYKIIEDNRGAKEKIFFEIKTLLSNHP